MSSEKNDAWFVEICRSCLTSLSNPPPGIDDLCQRIVEGETLDLFHDCDLDSLGSMEFCIHLELETGLVVTPEDLIRARTTTRLSKIMCSLKA